MQQPEPNGRVPWELFYGEMRDLRGVLEETRDAIQDMHRRFDTLPCAKERTALGHLEIQVAELRRNEVPWREGLDAVFDRRLVVLVLMDA